MSWFWGFYASIGRPERKQLRLDVRLQDARTGEILAEVAEIGSSENFFQLISRIGIKLRDRLGVPGIADTDEPSVLASLPSNPDAARVHSLGLAKLRDYDALAAKNLLEQAIKADRRFPLSHSMLARAWSHLGYEQKRKEENKKALDLSANLPRVNRMLVEGDYYECLAQHEKAASTYQALFALFPDSVEYGLQLALAKNAGGQKSQAMETIAELAAFHSRPLLIHVSIWRKNAQYRTISPLRWCWSGMLSLKPLHKTRNWSMQRHEKRNA